MIAFFGVVVFACAGAWFAAGQLIGASPKTIDVLPPGLPSVEVTIPGAAGATIRGWFTSNGGHAILLMHGLRGDRRAMLGRVKFLHAAGYNTLAIDMRAHGESTGDCVTFGHLESQDADHVLAWLRAKCPGRKVGVIGESLGGAAALLGDTPIAADAFVIESLFPDFARAIENRIDVNVGSFATWLLAPMLTVQFSPRMGVSLDGLRPVDAIQSLTKPVFVMGGELDTYTPPAETRELFAAAPEPKSLWIVPGRGHRNLHSHAPDEYERRVLAFFATHLK